MDRCAYLHKDSEERIQIGKLEEKLAAQEAKVFKLEQEINEIKKKFEAEATSHQSTPLAIEITNEKETADFKCNLCEFKSSRKNGLTVHVSRKHRNIEQLDGNTSLEILCDEKDKLYDNTEDYWIRGIIGRTYQTFIDAIQIIDESTLDEA